MAELGSLLGRWHQWRHQYSHERGYARALLTRHAADDDDALELLVMETVEREVMSLPRDLQLAVQHVARAECLGVEVMHHPMLAATAVREPLVARAIRELRHRLLQAGVM